MDIALAVVVALLLVAATVIIHYEVLHKTSRLMPHLSLSVRSRTLVVITGILVAHILEICLYAAIYYLMHSHFELGSIAGEFRGEVLDFFYFSATSYTTLGVGDVFPQGPLRIVAGIEALNGFVLIGWSASFTYVVLRRSWEQDGG